MVVRQLHGSVDNPFDQRKRGHLLPIGLETKEALRRFFPFPNLGHANSPNSPADSSEKLWITVGILSFKSIQSAALTL